MTTLLALVAGLVAALVLERAMGDTFAKPVLQRSNYREHVLPTASGLVLVAAVIVVEGARSVLALVGLGDLATAPDRVLVLVAVVAFGFLGLADDLLGDGRERGLKGHIRAALSGRASTGFVKLVGGVSVALVLAGAIDGDRPVRVLVDGALIALAANMGNLFDRAPGRTAKVGLLAAVPLLVVAGTSATGVALAVVVGATIGLLPSDLRERSMLGDTGANALGAALGVATVLVASPTARAVVAGVLLALTLVSEVVSFSRVIAAVPPLRALDGLGRLRVDEAAR
jgi:UDP-GlcNAc:undecaprenyl-phosphate GlcNAc-1-phosphate transferase